MNDQLKRGIQAQSQGAPPIKTRLANERAQLSQLPQFLDKTYSFEVPVYTVWGACEDVRVLEKFRSGEYKVDKLHIIDEASSRLLDIGGVKLRLLGLGGAVVMHKLFDNGEGKTTIAGGQGTMWTTLLQMGELIDTANRVYDPAETRVFVTHSSPAREGLLNQLSVTLKADFSISAGLHFRYGSSYNEFSVNPTLDHYRGKLAASKASFNDVWDTVKNEVHATVAQNPAQQTLLDNAIGIVDKMPSSATGPTPFGGAPAPGTKGEVDESAFKNMWNFNLADAAFGMLILEVEGGRIGTEMRAQGFNFAHRGGKTPSTAAVNATSSNSAPAPPAAPVPNNTAAPAPPVPAVPKPQTPVASQQTSQPSVPQASQAPPPSQPSPAPRVPGEIKPATPLNVPARTGSATPSGVKTQAAPSKPNTTATDTTSSTNQDSSTTATTESEKKKDEIQNGTNDNASSDTADKSASSIPANSAPPRKSLSPNRNSRKRDPETGIFVNGIDTVEAVRELFTEADRELIDELVPKTSHNGGKYFYVYFKSAEEAKSVLSRLSPDVTSSKRGLGEKGAHAKLMEEYPQSGGKWGTGGRYNKIGRGGSRGDHTRGSASESEGQGGALSDDKSGRGGRGGFGRGDRDGKPRGGFESRGGRGGRGGRGRGGLKSEGGEGAPSVPSTPALAPTTSS